MQQRRYGEWKNRLDGILFSATRLDPTYLPIYLFRTVNRFKLATRVPLEPIFRSPLSSFRALIRQIQINEEKEHRRLRNLIDSTSHRWYERANRENFRSENTNWILARKWAWRERERERKVKNLMPITKRGKRRRKIIKINRLGRFLLVVQHVHCRVIHIYWQ